MGKPDRAPFGERLIASMSDGLSKIRSHVHVHCDAEGNPLPMGEPGNLEELRKHASWTKREKDADVTISKERLQELEDAERIAWAMATGSNMGPLWLYVRHSVRNGLVSQWVLEGEGVKMDLNLCSSRNPVTMPMLTPDARALIRAARETGATIENKEGD